MKLRMIAAAALVAPAFILSSGALAQDDAAPRQPGHQPALSLKLESYLPPHLASVAAIVPPIKPRRPS